MTKEAMARMAETMHHYRQTKSAKVLTEKWNEFFGGAREASERLGDVTGGEEDEDVYKEEAIAFYAELNSRFYLTEEVETIEGITLNHSMSGSISHLITNELIVTYSEECARPRRGGSVLVTESPYIVHPIINEDEMDACVDLSVVELRGVLAYLTSHTIYAKSNAEAIGLLLEKED